MHPVTVTFMPIVGVNEVYAMYLENMTQPITASASLMVKYACPLDETVYAEISPVTEKSERYSLPVR